MIHHGDCVEVMATMGAESVDAIVTDPPYGLGFMGKEWDSIGDTGRGARARVERADEVTPTGRGHTTSAGPYLAAGVDSLRSAGRPYQEWCERWAREAYRVAKPGAHLLAFGGTRTYHRLAAAIEDARWEIRDCLVWAYASGFPKSLNLDGDWQGWGTALKPAWEPIVMARKPLVGTVRANVERHGTGALNIDGCRIPSEPHDASRDGEATSSTRYGDRGIGFQPTPGPRGGDALGRWPANVILTDPIFDGDTPGVVGGGTQSGGGNPPRRISEPGDGVTMRKGWRGGETGLTPVDTSGTYSRFFLIPKADRADREPVLGGLDERRVSSRPDGRQWDIPGSRSKSRQNYHPTVKPVDLMRHLVRLVTPPGGLVLDPFLGSGTTALACEMEGLRWVGIEREAEYVAIAEARLNGTQRGLGLAVEAPAQEAS